MPEEAVFFGRSGIFGLVLAVAYWFVSYEVAGTVLLAGFGLATGAAFLVLGRAARGRDVGEAAAPFEDEGGRVPLRSFAPLWVGVGLAVMSLAMAFGVWVVLAGVVPLALGAGAWLAEVGRESER